MKWTDAAFRILTDEAAALDYRELANRIVGRSLVDTKTRTPEITLHVSLSTENRSRSGRGLVPRFTIRKGVVGLEAWEIGGLDDARATIDQTREKTKRDLLAKLRKLDGQAFEAFLEVLFAEMGYNVTVVGGSDDEGVDLIAELATGVGIQKIGIQAKCLNTRRTVGQNVIRLLRDALSTYGCNAGAVVTTTTFDPKAVEVSEESGKQPVTLVDCHDLFDLAAEFQVGVRLEGFRPISKT